MASSIPSVYAALTALAETALPDAQIVQGQVGQYIADEQLLFGNTDFADTPRTVGYPTFFSEAYSIQCEAWMHQGGKDLNALRIAVMVMYEAFRDAVYVDRSLGLPEPLQAWLGSGTVAAGFDTNGISASVVFAVNVTNLTS